MKRLHFVTLFALSSLFVHLPANAKGALGEVFGVLLGKSVGNTLGKASADPQKVETVLKQMADQLNAKMPVTVDADTRADSIVAGPGVRFTYNYTIVTATGSQLNRETIVSYLEKKIKPSVCANPDMQIFFKNKVTVGYSYRASDGMLVAKMDVTPADCGYAA